MTPFAAVGVALAAGLAVAGVQGPALASHDVTGAGMSPARYRTPTFNSISADSPSDIWAAGWNGSDTSAGPWRLEHSDGTTFTQVTPPAGAVRAIFNAVSASAPDDVWLLGSTLSGDALLRQWDGSSWRHVTALVMDGLRDVDAVSASDVFLAGSSANNRPLVEHFDGSDWSVAATPKGGSHGGDLYDVATGAGGTVWAVGEGYRTRGGTFGDTALLALEWNGTAWVKRTLPDAGAQAEYDRLNAVAPVSATDVWAAGYRGHQCDSGYCRSYTPELDHWDGSTWTSEGSVIPGAGGELFDVSASGPNDVWAVGFATATSGASHPIGVHWDGATWTTYTLPKSPGAGLHWPNGVVTLSPTDAYAVGTGNRRAAPAIWKWDGTSWSVQQP